METVRLSVRVVPNASRTELVGRHADAWKVKVKAPPEGGRANKELCEFLAKLLGVPKRAVTVLGGQTSRNKILAIAGVTETQVLAHLNHSA